MMYIAVYLFSVLLASVSQILLKKSALQTYSSWWREYLNPYVVLGYVLLLISMSVTIFAYRGVPLKTGPVLEATSYIYVAVLSYLFLGEKVSARKKMGLLLIFLGIVIATF